MTDDRNEPELSAETLAEVEEALDRAFLYVGTPEHLAAAYRSRLEVVAVDLFRRLTPTFEQLFDALCAVVRMLAQTIAEALDAVADLVAQFTTPPPSPPPSLRPAPVRLRPTSWTIPPAPRLVTPRVEFLTHHRRTR